MDSADYQARFGGIGRLYGNDGLDVLKNSTFAIIGIGGVGSWVAESLARSGVGHIVLMDLDDLCITNVNRQIHALSCTIGQSKSQAMANRIADINPNVKVTCLDCFYTPNNAEKLFELQPDVIIDAIDSLNHKAHLIATCYRAKQPLISCGGAGGRIDPTQIEVADLSKTYGDPLLSVLRKKLKQEYKLPLGEKSKKLKIPCVFSAEKPYYPTCDGAVSKEKDPQFAGKMKCDTGFGSITHITGTFGFFMAAEAIKLLHKHKRPSISQ